MIDQWSGWLIAAMSGTFGVVLGSFLNVCSIRWPQDQSVVSPRSECPRCRTLIAWYDNVPVLSWLALRARCRSCGERISLQYPLVELTMGLVWAGLFAYHGLGFEALRGSLLLTLLFGISLSDARFYIIPHEFSIGGTGLGIALSFLPGVSLAPGESLLGAAVGLGGMWLVAVAGTWMIRNVRPGRLEEAGVDRALGGGDVRMMGLVGAFLGVWGVATTAFFGSVLALLVFGPVTYFSRRLVPLGVFLAAGAALTYGWGDAILEWYRLEILGL